MHRRVDGPLAHGLVAAVAGLFCVVALACVVVGGTAERSFVDEGAGARHDPHQYQYQAEALLEGHVHLDIPVPEWLAELEYPYDPTVRARQAQATHEPYYWDYAFYQGRYYCYFGLLPVVTLFVPYRLVTGADLSNHAATAILAALAVLAVTALTLEVVRRVDGEASIAVTILSLVMAYVASGVLYLAFLPTFYHIAILSALVCATGGIACWMRADRGAPGPRRGPLALGSFLVGACLLARPAMFLVALLAFPLFGHRFWRVPRQERQFFSREPGALLNTALVVLPILAMACVCMCWNVARFGSVLDFGYRYNLTAFDMVAQRLDPNKVLYGLVMYFLAPIIPSVEFPFMTSYQIDCGLLAGWASTIAYLGLEPYYGGLLAFCPFALVLLTLVRRRTREALRRRGLAGLAALPVLIAVLIASFDATVSVTQRYQSEFFWLVGMSATVVYVMVVSELRKEPGHRRRLVAVSLAMSLLVVLAVALQLLNLFTTDRYAPLTVNNPDVWWTVRSWFGGSARAARASRVQ